MATETITTWSEGRDPGECGVAIDGRRITAEDLETVTTGEEAEALGIPGVLFDRWRAEQPTWPFWWWLEAQARRGRRGCEMIVDHIKQDARGMTRLLVGLPIAQREGLAELSARLGLSQQNLIRSAVARLLEEHRPRPAPPSEPEPKRRRGRPRKNRGEG